MSGSVLPSKRLSGLFGVAVLGVLLAGGLLAATLGGLPLLVGYVAAAGLLIGLGVATLRRLAASAAPPPRPACTCCGPSSPGDHRKPIEVV